jgi:hypothetical protein
MSMRAMQLKYNTRTKINKRNSENGFSLYYTDNQGGKGRTFRTSQGCRKGISGPGSCKTINYDIQNTCSNKQLAPRLPSRQQGYGLYLKRATMGIGAGGGGVKETSAGLASKVEWHGDKNNQGKYITIKRPPVGSTGLNSFTMSDYISNKKSKRILCDNSNNVFESNCYNDNNTKSSCFKGMKTYTKDIRYLNSLKNITHSSMSRGVAMNSSDQIARIKSRRGACIDSEGKITYETSVMSNSLCRNL